MATPNRRGAVYIVVLMAGLIVATMALASIETIRWHARDVRMEADNIEAKFAADAGFEAALAVVNSDPNWRFDLPHNTDSPVISLGGAQIRYRLIDGDGDLADDETDDCDLLVTTTVGSARNAWRATLELNPDGGTPLDCLNYAVATDHDFKLSDLAMFATNTSIASNRKIEAKNVSTITADCAAVDSFSGAIYGSLTSLAEDVNFPGSDVFDYYLDNGTEIELNDIPKSGSRYVLSNHLISANSNTLNGVLNPQGIYFIECDNKEISIENCRLQCTLVLIDPKKDSRISGSVHWEAPLAYYPILLVDGSIELDTRREPLNEASAGTNFNPNNTSFRGFGDTDTTDSYPSHLRGLIYASKDIDVPNSLAEIEIVGCLIAGEKCDIKGDCFLRYSDVFSQNPPPGFGSSWRMRVVPGSVRRVEFP